MDFSTKNMCVSSLVYYIFTPGAYPVIHWSVNHMEGNIFNTLLMIMYVISIKAGDSTRFTSQENPGAWECVKYSSHSDNSNV